jgi:AcrR family transcriptional regulator
VATPQPKASGNGKRIRDRRHLRHEATRNEILETAWEMVRDDGVAALSLRALARAVGMEPQSVYTYFESKHAVYDAMFADGNRKLLERIAAQEWPDRPHAALGLLARLFMEFSAEDPARHELMFERPISGFEPSHESYALALEVVDEGRRRLAAVGIRDAAHFDLWTALVAGLASQQLAHDPEGNRWARLVDEAVDMYVEHVVGARPV